VTRLVSQSLWVKENDDHFDRMHRGNTAGSSSSRRLGTFSPAFRARDLP